MKYAISGASGQLGGLVARKLLDQVDPSEVILLSRDVSALSDFAARGVTVRHADFADPSTLPEAFAGVDRLVLVSTAAVGQERRSAQRNAIDAARAAGIDRVVYTSIPHPTADNPAVVASDHGDTESYLREAGINWIMLRNNLYIEMQEALITRAIGEGKLVTNNGDGRAAYVTRDDCAAVAVAALLGDVDNRAYDITGPVALSTGDLAAIASQRSGTTVHAVVVDDSVTAAALSESGMPADVVEVVNSFGTAIRHGWLSDVSTAVADLTGKLPTALA